MKHQQINNATQSIDATDVGMMTPTRPTTFTRDRKAPGNGASRPSTHRSLTGVTAALLAGSLSLVALPAAAQSNDIVEDCILEGTVDMRKAEQLNQPVYVRFSDAEQGSQAGCSLERRSKSRRVRFITTPDMHDIENVSHGAKVRYRYIERDGEPGTWELIGVRDRR
jgi:hypothetical protein